MALALLAIIVVSGAGVRLTGSGLGCDDWPNCNDEKFVDVSSYHAAIEQLNRLFTGVVGAAVLTTLPQFLTVFKDYETMVFGAVLIVTMVFFPQGVVPTLARLLGRDRR